MFPNQKQSTLNESLCLHLRLGIHRRQQGKLEIIATKVITRMSIRNIIAATLLRLCAQVIGCALAAVLIILLQEVRVSDANREK